jgi:hypothetical protein
MNTNLGSIKIIIPGYTDQENREEEIRVDITDLVHFGKQPGQHLDCCGEVHIEQKFFDTKPVLAILKEHFAEPKLSAV